MIQPSTIAENNDDAKVHTLPGSAYHIDNYSKEYFYLFKSGKATSFGNLESEKFCKREARELCDFLEQHTPAGIFKEFVIRLAQRDRTCNNYIKELK